MVERYRLTGRRDPGCVRVGSWAKLENTVIGHVNGVTLPEMLPERPDAVESEPPEIDMALVMRHLGVRFEL